MKRALIVMSVAHGDSAQETLRVQDTAAALMADGWQVDVLASKNNSLLSIALPQGARIYRISTGLLARALRAFRVAALVRSNRYDVVHGFDDGAETARTADRLTVERFGYIAEIHHPPPPVSVVRHAAVILVPSEETLVHFTEPPPKARVSVLADPHVELEPGALTFREFRDAIGKIYDYAAVKGAEA